MRASKKVVGLMAAVALAGGVAHARHKEHSLGPTGLFGVTSAKSISITRVEKGSPGEGKIKVGDVVIGAGRIMFKIDARREIADAIDQAETRRARGILKLTLKGGKKVSLKLKVLGTYSRTAPYDCPKTDAIITQTADYLVKTKKFGRGGMNIGLLGLLATGEQEYIDVVKGVIHGASWAKPDIKLTIETGGKTSWGWGYTTILLSEYYLLTKDEYVLPAIKAHSVALARGRDAGGLWGHGMAYLANNRGRMHGRLNGYAQMNQPSLSNHISMILAEKCGVKDRELRAGVEQTHAFYRNFIGKGALNYGVHGPNTKLYNNNGTSGSAAVAFAVKGTRAGADFFARLSATSYGGLETGHTGHFFNQLWTPLGANVAGPEVTTEFFKKTRWLQTSNRKWDGNFTYDDCAYKNGIYSYRGCSDAGSHLLSYCLGRRKLFITGKDADRSLWLKGREATDAIELSNIDYKGAGDKELLAMFGHPIPQVPRRAVWTLRLRDHKLLGSIRRMLKKGSPIERQSAIGYFGYGCDKEVAAPMLDTLGAILRDTGETPAFRATAAAALCWFGEPAYKYYPDMVKMIVADEPDDPFFDIDESVSRSMSILCKEPYRAGMVKDKDIFYKAALKLVDHMRQSGRTSGLRLIEKVPLRDFHRVADKVMYIIKDQDLTYQSYHNQGPRGAAITILATLKIKEGVGYLLDTLDTKTGKWGFKVRMLMSVLPKYGATARPTLAKLKADPRLTNVEKGKFGRPWRAMLKAIESAKSADRMISFEEAKRRGR